MECMGAVHDARAVGGAAREFDRGFDTFRPGIGKKYLVQIRDIFQQAFGQYARQRRYVQLHQVGQVAIEDALQGLAQGRMIAADRKNAKPAQ